MRLLFDFIYIPLALAYLPYLIYQMLALKKNRRGWGERLGSIPRRTSVGSCIWIHAVSLGEMNATPTLVAELRNWLSNCEIVISSTTDTGYTAARKLYPDLIVFRYPLDFSMVINHVMRRLRPAAIVLMELEVWPNLLLAAGKRNIPVAIVNGRVTEEKSMRRYRLPVVRQLSRWMFSKIACVGAQDETYAARFAELGVPQDRIAVTGTLKFDTAIICERIPGDEALATALGIRRDAPLIVAGSTGPGEEAMLLDAYARLRAEQPKLQLAIIPRKPERFAEVAEQITRAGYECVRRSLHPDGHMGNNRQSPSSAKPVVFLGDTMGELRKFYSLADLVFLGRTLVPMGGSDLMEIAALAKPMCYGPHIENFAEVSNKLLSENAARQIPSPDELASTLREMLNDRPGSRAMGNRAQEIVRKNTGATKKTVELICSRCGL